jgi:hypothetical protein
MKKAIILLLLVLTCTAAFPQFVELKKAHSEYIEYCNQSHDTIVTQTSSFTFEDIPLYSDCGNGKKEVFGYKRVIADTVWDESDSVFYTDDFNDKWTGISLNSYYFKNKGTLTPLAQMIFSDNTSCTPPTRQVKAKVYRERPSENGFYKWLYNKIK